MAAHQAPLSTGLSRQEHWSGLPFPSPIFWTQSCINMFCKYFFLVWLVFSFSYWCLLNGRSFYLYEAWFISFMFYRSCFLYHIKNFPNPSVQIFILYYLLKFSTLSSYIQIYNPFWVSFCVWCKVRVHGHSFACGYSAYSTSFVEDCFCHWVILTQR